jgi:hypothetical protein
MPAPIWFAPWKPGPAERTGPDDGPGGAAVVSVTDFAPHRPASTWCGALMRSLRPGPLEPSRQGAIQLSG